jgi:hypothetical protein
MGGGFEIADPSQAIFGQKAGCAQVTVLTGWKLKIMSFFGVHPPDGVRQTKNVWFPGDPVFR